jgi:hypothetical protein
MKQVILLYSTPLPGISSFFRDDVIHVTGPDFSPVKRHLLFSPLLTGFHIPENL